MANDRMDDVSERLKKLGDRLSKASRETTQQAPKPAGTGRAMGIAFRIATELVAAVFVGVAIGWGLDYWLGSKPAFLLVGFFLGVAAGVLNVYRATKPKPGELQVPRNQLPRVADDDDD